jgi:DNA-binding protein H-NS
MQMKQRRSSVQGILKRGKFMATLESINLKIAKLQQQAAAIAEKQTSVGLVKIRDLMHKHGLSVEDIQGFIGQKRGRKPSKTSANGAAKSVRVKAQPVAAKYADPKSGATWSGRGRAPAWIKDAKDRTRFLINGSGGEKAGSAKAAPAGKATVKRAAAKKVGRKTAAAKSAPAQRRAAQTTRKPARKAAARKAAAAAPVAAPAAAAE